MPSLSERKDDIPILVDYFLDELAKEYGKKKNTISVEALSYLQEQSWSGNIRELRNVTERLVIMSGSEISLEDVKQFA